jgi:predicted amidohydrolase YtcJ
MRAYASIFVAIVAIGAAQALAQTPGANLPPEVIFTHGVIYTGEGLAEGKPSVVEAMAIGGGKVLAVGTDAEVLKLAGPKTRLRDLSAAGRQVFLYPGFSDPHTHLGDLADKMNSQPSAEERHRWDELAIADALARGVTSVQDYSDWRDFLVFEQLEKEDKLNLRITEWLPFQNSVEELQQMRAHLNSHGPMLHLNFLKSIADGTKDSVTTAANTQFNEHAEQHKGRLIAGSDADFIFVDREFNPVAASGPLSAKVRETWVAGRQVFMADIHIR